MRMRARRIEALTLGFDERSGEDAKSNDYMGFDEDEGSGID